jgi:hypothetical protein
LLKDCCNTIFPFIGSNVTVFTVGNPNRRSETELFGSGMNISTVFPNLNFLCIENASHMNHLVSYLNDLSSFSSLKRLKISVVVDSSSHINREMKKIEIVFCQCVEYVLDKLLCTQHSSLTMIICNFESSIKFNKRLCSTNIKFLSISVLASTNDLINLLASVPNIERLKVRLSNTGKENGFNSIPWMLNLKAFIFECFEQKTAYNFEVLEAIITRCPCLLALSIDMALVQCSRQINGQYLEHGLLSHCKFLQKFYFCLNILKSFPNFPYDRRSIIESFRTTYWHQRNWSAGVYINQLTFTLYSIPFPYKKLKNLSADFFQYNVNNAVDWSTVVCLGYTTNEVILPPLLQAIAETFKNLTTLVFDSQVEFSHSNIILHNVRSLQLNCPMKKTFLKSIFSITPNVKTLKMDGSQLLVYTPNLQLTTLHIIGADMNQFCDYIIKYPALHALQITCNSNTNPSCQINVINLFDLMMSLRSLSVTVREDRNPYGTVHSSSSILEDLVGSIEMGNNVHYRKQSNYIQIWR